MNQAQLFLSDAGPPAAHTLPDTVRTLHGSGSSQGRDTDPVLGGSEFTSTDMSRTVPSALRAR